MACNLAGVNHKNHGCHFLPSVPQLLAPLRSAALFTLEFPTKQYYRIMPNSTKPQPKFRLKDHLFNRDRVEFLANLFVAVDESFDTKRFVRDTTAQFPKLELKARIAHIASVLEEHLHHEFRVAAKQINLALPPALDPKQTDGDFGDFILAPLGEFVVRRGLSKQHLKLSLRTLKELTMRFSMEDALRYFINEFSEPTFAELKKWSTDRNYHVRRLVSEATRPRLPWSGRLTTDIHRPLELLTTLHADPTRYVTRSVANHLNDIAKTDPSVVIKTLMQWRGLALQRPAELKWMTAHALRTLVKQGDETALRLLGYRDQPKITISSLELSATSVAPGEAIGFQFDLSAQRDERLLIDYVIDFVKAGGKTGGKVFKLKQLELAKGKTQTITKRHPFRADATTFRLYPGVHRITLQINGKRYATATFEMKADRA